MSRKQKKMLVRIIVTAVLFAGLFVFEKFVPITSRILRLAVYMVPYLVMALIYIVLVLIISAGIKLMERGLAKSDRRN